MPIRAELFGLGASVIADAIREERAITPAARWLVDNVHVVEGAFTMVVGSGFLLLVSSRRAADREAELVVGRSQSSVPRRTA